jgi:hypothetical protein
MYKSPRNPRVLVVFIQTGDDIFGLLIIYNNT